MREVFNKNDWEHYAECYDVLNELRPYSDMFETVLATLGNIRYPLLDAGCGTGNLIAQLPAHSTAKVVGIDASMAMLARANVKCPRAEFWLADLDTTLPFDASSFGTITCLNALYAVADPSNTLREFNRILRPAGSLVIVVPKPRYQNGLILKSHCQSEKPDSYWLDAHRSRKREERLIREAVKEKITVDRFLRLARFNRAIANEPSFHFLNAQELSLLLRANGFTDVRIKETYADQNFLVTAIRSENGSAE